MFGGGKEVKCDPDDKKLNFTTKCLNTFVAHCSLKWKNEPAYGDKISYKAFLFSNQDKGKKKGKGKNKATNDNNQGKNESKQENQQGQAIANTVQTAADVRTTAASIVAVNKMRNPDNVKALKPEIKKETRKSSFPGIKDNSTPRTLPPLEKQKKNVPSSKGAVPRRKITPQGHPQVSKLYESKLRLACTPAAIRCKRRFCPSPFNTRGNEHKVAVNQTNLHGGSW